MLFINKAVEQMLITLEICIG